MTPAGALTLFAAAASLAPLVTATRVGAQDAVEPVEPQERVVFHLDQAEGRPGDIVTLVLSIETSTPLKAISVAIDFDEGRLAFEDTTRVLDQLPAAPLEEVKTEGNNTDDTPGDQPQEGYVVIELVARTDTNDFGWPVGEIVPVYKLRFRILDEAGPGFAPVRFGEVGPLELAAPVRNVVQVKDNIIAPADAIVLPPEDLKDGGVIILGIGEVGFFLRGDANMSRRIEMADAILTLGFLFHGKVDLVCRDAADTNDDGTLDLSDPVFTLGWMFIGGSRPPEPRACGGIDPTADVLGCLVPDCRDCIGCSPVSP
jgi:hypothetical protein